MTYHEVSGGDGRRAVFSLLRATVAGQAVMRIAGDGPRPAATRVGPAAADEPAPE
jgi:hypothetical protein